MLLFYNLVESCLVQILEKNSSALCASQTFGLCICFGNTYTSFTNNRCRCRPAEALTAPLFSPLSCHLLTLVDRLLSPSTFRWDCHDFRSVTVHNNHEIADVDQSTDQPSASFGHRDTDRQLVAIFAATGPPVQAP